MKKIIVFVVIAAIAAYLLFWPVPIEPVAWRRRRRRHWKGLCRQRQARQRVSIWAGKVSAEDVAIDDNGYFYVGYDDGRIVRFDPDGGTPT